MRRDISKDGAGAGYELVPGILRIDLEGSGHLGAVLRMNASSIWFEPDPSQTVPYGRMGTISLVTSEVSYGPFTAQFGIEALDDDVHAVAHLRDVKLADGQLLVAFMLTAARKEWARPVRPGAAVQTDITDPVRIRAVLQSLKHRTASAVIKKDDFSLEARLTGFDEDAGTLFWQFSGRVRQVPLNGDVSIEVAGYNCVYHMHFTEATRLAYGVSTPVPDRIDYNRYRRYRRAPISDSTTVRFKHPLWAEIPPIHRPLLDVSFGGIALIADPLEDALYIGMRVDPIEILRETPPGGEAPKPIILRGTVRSLVPLSDGTTTCGLSVEPAAPEYAEAWASFVMQALNQTTAPVGDRVELLWQLYTDSGYFSLSGKTPAEFDALARSFRTIVDNTSSKPWLSYNSVWLAESKVEASVSTIKLYRHSWMLHQLAKRTATHGDPRARNILRDIYLRAFEYMQTDSQCRWVLSYAEAHVRWVQRSHVAFAEHFEPTGAALARPFRLMEANCRERVEVPPAQAFRIAAPYPDEETIILDALRQSLPAPYLEATDLVPDRFDLRDVVRAWGDCGLSRAREVWVARQQGRPYAAAILEVGETGTNLFRLTDSLRLVSLQQGGEAAFFALIEKAKAWFLAKGKDSFVYFWEHPDRSHVRDARLRDLGEGRVWVIRADLIPDFLELVCELTSRSGGPDPGRHEGAVPGPQSVRGEFMFQPSSSSTGASDDDVPIIHTESERLIIDTVEGAVPGPVSSRGRLLSPDSVT